MSSDALEILAQLKPDWFKDAACRNEPKDRFFLEDIKYELFSRFFLRSEKSFKRLKKSELEEIKREIEEINRQEFCNNCPVRQLCEDAGKYETYGQWGGLNFEQRFNKMEEQDQWKFFKMKEKRDKNS